MTTQEQEIKRINPEALAECMQAHKEWAVERGRYLSKNRGSACAVGSILVCELGDVADLIEAESICDDRLPVPSQFKNSRRSLADYFYHLVADAGYLPAYLCGLDDGFENNPSRFFELMHYADVPGYDRDIWLLGWKDGRDFAIANGLDVTYFDEPE